MMRTAYILLWFAAPEEISVFRETANLRRFIMSGVVVPSERNRRGRLAQPT